MALNFPSAPADGDVYDNWVYSSAKGAWQAKPLKPAVTATQSNPPSAPNDGDMWFNTNDGTTYVWYDDGDTAQWVEMVAPLVLPTPLEIDNGGTGAATALEARDNLGVGLANIVPSGVTYVTGSGSVNSDGKVTFTGCSKVQVAGVFSSDFTNYKIIILLDGNGISQGIQFRMMTGTSTEATASQYTLQGVNATATSAPVSFANSGTQWDIGNTWGRYSCDMTIHGPHLTIGTNINFQMLNLINTPAWRYVGASARHDGNLAYTGFSLFWPSGTTGGQVQVFGFNG